MRRTDRGWQAAVVQATQTAVARSDQSRRRVRRALGSARSRRRPWCSRRSPAVACRSPRIRAGPPRRLGIRPRPRGELVPPGAPELRKAVQEQDERSRRRPRRCGTGCRSPRRTDASSHRRAAQHDSSTGAALMVASVRAASGSAPGEPGRSVRSRVSASVPVPALQPSRDEIHHRGVLQRRHIAQRSVLGDVAQQAPHDLAGAGLGQLRDEHDLPWLGDRSERLGDVFAQFLDEGLVARRLRRAE